MKKVIAYFPNWGTYNAAHHNLRVSMIPWEKIAVINHSFYSIDASFEMAYAKVPYLYNSTLKIMLTYEDEQSLSERCD